MAKRTLRQNQGKKRKQSVKKRKFGFFGPFNLSLISFVLGFVGQYFLFIKRQLGPGLFFFAVAIIVFIAADIIAGKKEKSFSDEPEGNKTNKKDGFKLTRKTEMIIFALIIFLAIFFRTFMIDTVPSGCYRDEGQNGNEAINIMTGLELEGTTLPVYIERFTQNAAMFMYFIAASFKLFGIGIMQIRGVSVLLGVLTVGGFYFMIRYMFGVRMAIVGGIILATMRWHVNFSRMGFLGVFTVMLFVMAFYFAYRVYKERKLSDFLGLALTTSLSLYSYIAARLIPAGFVIFGAYLLVRDTAFYKRHFKKIIVAAALFIIVLAPLGSYVIKHLDAFMTRTGTVSIFNNDEMLKAIGGVYVDKEGNPKHWTKLYARNVKNTMLMMNYIGDGNPRHNYGTKPMLDFMSGIFFIIGFGYIVFRMWNPYYFMYLSMFFALLQAGLLSIESPQAYRTITIIPLVAIAIVIVFDRMWKFCEVQFGDRFKTALMTGGLIVLAIIAYDNYDSYFNGWAKDSGAWAEFSTDEWNMGRYLKNLGPDWEGVVNPAWTDSYTFKFATYPNRNYVEFSPSEWIPIKSKIYKNYVYILDGNYLPLKSVFEKMYPGGRYTDFKHRDGGRILYFTYEVPYNEVKRYQEKPQKNGLTAVYFSDDHRKDLKDVNNHWDRRRVDHKTIDPFILFNWTKDPVFGPFSVEWTGTINIEETGNYQFMTKSNDYSDLYIDGKIILKNPGGGGGLRGETANIMLKKGKHDIKVRYYESVQYSKMQLWWRTPSTPQMQIVPSEVLFPE